jgi:hypothetical protein
MRLIQHSAGWQSLDTAPHGEDVTLLVTDGPSEPYQLKAPSRLTAAGWVCCATIKRPGHLRYHHQEAA